MKKFLSMLLVLTMIFSLTVSAFADSSVTRDGKNIYSESNTVVVGDLYNEFLSFYDGTDYSKLVKDDVRDSIDVWKLLDYKVNSTTVNRSSISFTLDGTTPITKGSRDTVDLSAGSHSVTITFKYHAEYMYQKFFDSAQNGSYDGTFTGDAQSFNFSVRYKSVIKTAANSVSYVYGTENPKDVIMSVLQPTVTLKDGTQIGTAADVKIVDNVSNLDAGKYTITLQYAGMDNGSQPGYQPATKEITLNVTKIPTSIKVDSSAITYDGKEHMPKITVTPENVPYTVVTVGLQGDAVGFASIYMSEGNSLYKALIFIRDSGDTLTRLAKLLGFDISDFVFGSEGLSLEQVHSLISRLNDISDVLTAAGIILEESQINDLLDTLDAIGEEMAKYNINAKFYIGNMPKNAGLYAVRAVIAEDNYESSWDYAAVWILRDYNATMMWKQSTSGYTFTPDNVKKFDFKAYVTDGNEELVSNIKYTITGTASDGTKFSSDSLDNLPTLPGTYKETASDSNYASSLSRSFTVNKYPTTVKFVDQNGKVIENASIDAQYDGQAKGFTAKVFDKDGKVIEGANVTYTYTGTTKAGVKYNSNQAPFDSGDYTLKASFTGDTMNAASNATAVIAIHKAPATITFDNVTTRILKKIDCSSIGYTYTGMTADEAARIASTLSYGSWFKLLLLGTRQLSYSVPTDISAKYDVTVSGGQYTVKLFG